MIAVVRHRITTIVACLFIRVVDPWIKLRLMLSEEWR